MKQKLKDLQEETDKPAIIVEDFNCLLSTIDRNRQKISNRVFEHCQPIWPNWLLENILPNSSKIHIIFKYIWNIYKDRQYSGLQNKSCLINLKGCKSHNFVFWLQ